MKDLLKKLQSEKTKGKNLTIKTFLTYDEKRLIVQVIAPNSIIEKSFNNSEGGEEQLKAFVSRFKTLKDIQNYFKK